MFGWRKRRDGFEWKQYVRTTILVRRERRRQRIDELREAAIDNLKEAGRKGADAGAASLDAAQRQARRGFGAAASATGGTLAAFAERARPLLASLAAPLRRPGMAIAPIGAGLRHLADRFYVFFGSWHLNSGAVQVAVLLGAIVGGTSLYSWWRNPAPGTPTASLAANATAPRTTADGATISGRATVASGDTLRVGDTTIRLGGIEAPDRGFACARDSGKRWDCGQSAAQALTRHVRGKTVKCSIGGRDQAGTAKGTCRIGEDDIAAALVSGGHVFAESGLFAAYTGLEAKARSEHSGIWAGDAERPADYRARRWEDAKKAAPEGCPIKGRITSGSRVYVLPWSPAYERAKIRSSRGERWFCSEQDAIAAGWKADPHTPRGGSS